MPCKGKEKHTINQLTHLPKKAPPHVKKARKASILAPSRRPNLRFHTILDTSYNAIQRPFAFTASAHTEYVHTEYSAARFFKHSKASISGNSQKHRMKAPLKPNDISGALPRIPSFPHGRAMTRKTGASSPLWHPRFRDATSGPIMPAWLSLDLRP